MSTNAVPKNKESDIPMISANEARNMTDAAQFRKSGYECLINSAIREVAANGKDFATILIPDDIAEQAAKFLTSHGFRVGVENAAIGTVITAAW